MRTYRSRLPHLPPLELTHCVCRRSLEKVREEVEARRAMPEELRLKEDTDRAEKTRKEKKRGQQAFLQKYHHKGVFHQVRLAWLASRVPFALTLVFVRRTWKSSKSTTTRHRPNRPSPTFPPCPPSCRSATLAKLTRPSTRI